MPDLKDWKRRLVSDSSLPLEDQLFQTLCLLGGVICLFVILPLNYLQNLSPWIDRGIIAFAFVSLASAWAARRGRYYKKAYLICLVVLLDLIWFPNGGSQGSIGLYFFTAGLFLVLFFKRGFRIVGMMALVANIIALHLIEFTWPAIPRAFQSPVDRLLDVSSGYLISMSLSALILWVVQGGFNRERQRVRGTLQALQASEERYRLLIENAVDEIWTLDFQGRFAFVSPSVQKVRGYTPAELMGMTLEEAFIPASAALAREELRLVVEAAARNDPFPEFRRELEERCKNGSTIWTEVTATGIRGEDGRIVGIFGIARNIAERKKADRALAEREAELRAIFESSQDAIGVVQHGLHEMVNPAFLSMFGYQRAEDLVGVSLLDLIAPESRYAVLANMEARAQGADVPTRYEATGLRRDGTKFPMEIHLSTYERGGGLHTVASLRDLSERTRLEKERLRYEAQARHNEKMESLGALAGGVAHDMNNVLGAVLGLASIHLVDAPQGSVLRKDMETIVKACERGGSMVRGLLGFARDSLPEERELDLNVVVREAVALLERTTLQRIHLETDLCKDLLHLRGDSAALGHALMNLCVNAVDAMPDGGTLSVRTRNQADDTIVLEVADTGSGMPKEVLDKALDPFFTTKPQGKGTGLGLPIVFGTVKAHQGNMELLSEVGKGTQVRMYFPVCNPGVEESKATVEAQPRQEQKALRILVVDDDELLQHAIRRLLKNLGHDATSVTGGEGALAMIADGFAPDLVILDMNMPGMDGAATLPRIRSLLPRVPVLLATGRADQAAIDLVEAHAHVTLLPKPFDLRDLRQTLEQLTGQEFQ